MDTIHARLGEKRRINFMALNSYFCFPFLPFSFRPLTSYARPQSREEKREKDEEKSVRHNVCNI